MNSRTARTSDSHPLRIDYVQPEGAPGRIGLTFCPGKVQPDGLSGSWKRDLRKDLHVIADAGTHTLVTLIEQHEIESLKVRDLGVMAASFGMDWIHLPIKDTSIPSPEFEKAWEVSGAQIKDALLCGDDIVVHCKGGLGRAGTVSARLLVELGEEPEDAIRSVRASRRGAIENVTQENYIRSLV